MPQPAGWIRQAAYGASVRGTASVGDPKTACRFESLFGGLHIRPSYMYTIADAAGEGYQPATTPVQLAEGNTFLALGEANSAAMCAIAVDRAGTGW